MFEYISEKASQMASHASAFTIALLLAIAWMSIPLIYDLGEAWSQLFDCFQLLLLFLLHRSQASSEAAINKKADAIMDVIGRPDLKGREHDERTAFED